MKTQKQREEERRREKLALIEDQVKQGQLTIRKMTKQERAAHPPRKRAPKRGRR